ncbi:4-hydroxyacetophenone monooxygenase [Radiomyces spectabilis]|uniref:4-hydroxyacetophenone monooxygenase n=1 Tax=Radiomyces spectabilis TaxID=64574 RepID=UPI00221F10DB|nr:4-hydroxyacetophenone monooxygenase [Radiomyces spectabilis]KAI8368243.1 4-hydroxyacetophenone monooxygenase [Radiomyces spectabilis]
MTKPAIHPVYAAAYQNRKAVAPPLETMPPQVVRAFLHDRALTAKVPLPNVLEEDRQITMDDQQVNINLIRPEGTQDKILPVIIYLHGGGWVFGNKHTHAKIIRELAIQTEATVLFVDYALSPEAKFPVALEQCYATVKWVLANADSIKVDANKIAIAGDSAGGNMSAGVCIMAKQRGLVPNAIKAQVLLYPALAASHEEFPSFEIFGQGDYNLSKKEAEYFCEQYYSAHPVEMNNVLATPILATSEELAGTPSTLILTAEADILRDEAEAFGRKLQAAGVDCLAVRIVGAVHGYITVPVETPQYRHSLSLISKHITDTFAKVQK